MNKIPTAEEFAKTHHPMKTYPVDHQMMIEFAKLHVEAALKAAFEDVPCGSSSDIPSCKEVHAAIFNSYPLENIK